MCRMQKTRYGWSLQALVVLAATYGYCRPAKLYIMELP